MIWHKNILATHEEKQVTSLGAWPGDEFKGVALPSAKALRLLVKVRYNEKEVEAMCADVGPWAIDDDGYVFEGWPPRAEMYLGRHCPLKMNSDLIATVPDSKGNMVKVEISNGAGIDLFPATAKALGIPIGHNVKVSWALII